MTFILGTSPLGYDVFDDSSNSYMVTIYQPDAIYGDSAYPGEILLGALELGGGHEELEIHTVVE